MGTCLGRLAWLCRETAKVQDARYVQHDDVPLDLKYIGHDGVIGHPGQRGCRDAPSVLVSLSSIASGMRRFTLIADKWHYALRLTVCHGSVEDNYFLIKFFKIFKF